MTQTTPVHLGDKQVCQCELVSQDHNVWHPRKDSQIIIIIIIIINHFYIALFSTLEQTHCARMWFYMSESFL